MRVQDIVNQLFIWRVACKKAVYIHSELVG